MTNFRLAPNWIILPREVISPLDLTGISIRYRRSVTFGDHRIRLDYRLDDRGKQGSTGEAREPGGFWTCDVTDLVNGESWDPVGSLESVPRRRVKGKL